MNALSLLLLAAVALFALGSNNGHSSSRRFESESIITVIYPDRIYHPPTPLSDLFIALLLMLGFLLFVHC